MNPGLVGDPGNVPVAGAGSGKRSYPGIGHYIPGVEIYTGAAAMPSAGSAATLAHGMGGTPQVVQVVLQCTDAGGDAGHAEDDEIGIECFHPYSEENTFIRGSEPGGVFKVQRDGTNIEVTRGSSVCYWDNQSFDLTKWQFKVYALRFSLPETPS